MRHKSKPIESLNAMQRKAVELFAQGLPVGDVAHQVKRTVRMVNIWRTRPLFAAAEKTARAAYMESLKPSDDIQEIISKLGGMSILTIRDKILAGDGKLALQVAKITGQFDHRAPVVAKFRVNFGQIPNDVSAKETPAPLKIVQPDEMKKEEKA